jgi:hypothetical protein
MVPHGAWEQTNWVPKILGCQKGNFLEIRICTDKSHECEIVAEQAYMGPQGGSGVPVN